VLVFASFALMACGGFMMVIDPANWMIALVPIVFFGICAAVTMWMLMERQRSL
jgi:hypothetical protein